MVRKGISKMHSPHEMNLIGLVTCNYPIQYQSFLVVATGKSGVYPCIFFGFCLL